MKINSEVKYFQWYHEMNNGSNKSTINLLIYFQWYHEMNNGSMHLLRTGSTQGTPYEYTVRVRQIQIQLKKETLMGIQCGYQIEVYSNIKCDNFEETFVGT